jgi:hypothetical protein
MTVVAYHRFSDMRFLLSRVTYALRRDNPLR